MISTADFLNIVMRADGTNVKNRANKLYLTNDDIRQFIDLYYPGKSVTEVAYIITYDIKETPRCRTCGKELKFDDFIHGYRIYCNKSCKGKDRNPIQVIPDREINRQEIIDTFYKDGQLIEQHCIMAYLKKHGWYNSLMSYYSDTESCEETIYRIAHDLDERPVCRHCGGPVKFKHKFNTFCCRYCQNNDEEVLMKNKQNVSKSLLKAYEERGDEIKEKRKKTLSEHFNVEIDSSSPFAIDEINKKASKHTSPSLNETVFQDFLNLYFLNDYKVQYKSKRYPFKCDFYIISLDLFIEIQGTWMHGDKPYEGTDEDNKLIDFWKSKKGIQYIRAINTWTEKDVLKRNIAKQNNLNYLEIFSKKPADGVEDFKIYLKKQFKLDLK